MTYDRKSSTNLSNSIETSQSNVYHLQSAADPWHFWNTLATSSTTINRGSIHLWVSRIVPTIKTYDANATEYSIYVSVVVYRQSGGI